MTPPDWYGRELVLRIALIVVFTLMGGIVANAQSANTSARAGLTVTLGEPDDSGRVGEIRHENRETTGLLGERFFEWETERGRVTLRLDTTANSECDGPNPHGCPDTVTIWELPEGVYAHEMEVTTPERGVSVITLFLWSGM
jgi:hypothetical protein